MKQSRWFCAIGLAMITLMGCLASAARAQASNQNTINDPLEFKAYAAAASQNNPAAKAAALESFLQAYPESAARKPVLNMLMNTYRKLNDNLNALSAAKRCLELDSNDVDAIFIAVEIEINECNRAGDAEICNDAAALGKRGLSISKPPAYTDDEWRKTTAVTYTYYRAAIALARPLPPALAPVPSPSPIKEIAPPTPPANTPPPTISLGQTEDQVTAGLGQPLKVARVGAKVIFFYKDMKVIFNNGKVSNIE
jgi:hypothetical protein